VIISQQVFRIFCILPVRATWGWITDTGQPMNTRTDKELLDGIRRGEAGDFTTLYKKYVRRVYAYCYRMIPNHENAEDLVQQTFVKAYESIASLENPELFYSWLFSIARNEVYAFLRHRRSNGGVLSGLDDEEIVCSEESPLELLVGGERTMLLQKTISGLKLEYREILILRHYERLSYAEIAAMTGDTISSVESRLYKARRALAEKLSPYFK
jgi:RNA polymerase sigma-70 factor, ECF subfamily